MYIITAVFAETLFIAAAEGRSKTARYYQAHAQIAVGSCLTYVQIQKVLAANASDTDSQSGVDFLFWCRE